MTGLHSTWLMPQAADATELKAIIDELAQHFGRPRFHPHLTMTEEVRSDAADLAQKVEAAAEGARAIDATVESIDTSSLFFRCLYARFSIPPVLASLRAKLASRLGINEGVNFIPHVSLLYGVPESAEKRVVRDRVSSVLLGRTIRFDHLCIVASAKEIPIEKWKLCAQIRLPT